MPTQRPQEDTQPAQIRELVSKYCRLDYDGARLNPADVAEVSAAGVVDFGATVSPRSM